MFKFFIIVQLSRTLVSTFLLFAIFTICIIRYLLNTLFNLNINPPKAHPFVEKPIFSAIGDTVIVLGIGALSPFIFNVVLSSAYLYSAGLFFSNFFHGISLGLVPVLIGIMDFIIQNTLDMYTDALVYLNNPANSLAMLREAHGYLTPYIRSYNSLFHLIERIVLYLVEVDSSYVARVTGLGIEYRDAGYQLLEVYRSIEREISISIDESPIDLQVWE